MSDLTDAITQNLYETWEVLTDQKNSTMPPEIDTGQPHDHVGIGSTSDGKIRFSINEAAHIAVQTMSGYSIPVRSSHLADLTTEALRKTYQAVAYELSLRNADRLNMTEQFRSALIEQATELVDPSGDTSPLHQQLKNLTNASRYQDNRLRMVEDQLRLVQERLRGTPPQAAT